VGLEEQVRRVELAEKRMEFREKEFGNKSKNASFFFFFFFFWKIFFLKKKIN
jgi:hypothetical protein